jgi:hypothetical protein
MEIFCVLFPNLHGSAPSSCRSLGMVLSVLDVEIIQRVGEYLTKKIWYENLLENLHLEEREGDVRIRVGFIIERYVVIMGG